MEFADKTPNQSHSIPSHFQWSFWSWFGAIVGSTSWMLVVASFFIAWREEVVSAIPIASFVFVNLLAIGLWLRRSRLSSFHGLMTVFMSMAIAFPVTWFSVMHFASPQVLAAMRWPNSFFSTAVVVLIVPCITLRFWILERQARNRALIWRDVPSNV